MNISKREPESKRSVLLFRIQEGKAGLTPLHIAIENGNEPLVNFLLDECPKLRLEAVTYAGLTAYQLAVIQHNQTLQNGLKRRGAEPLSPPESDEETDESDDSMDEEQVNWAGDQLRVDLSEE